MSNESALCTFAFFLGGFILAGFAFFACFLGLLARAPAGCVFFLKLTTENDAVVVIKKPSARGGGHIIRTARAGTPVRWLCKLLADKNPGRSVKERTSLVLAHIIASSHHGHLLVPLQAMSTRDPRGFHEKTCLVLTHANGFCRGTWAPFVEELAMLLGVTPPHPSGALSSRSDSSHWTIGGWLDVLAVDLLGHGGAAPMALLGAETDWGQLGRQIIDVVQEYELSGPEARVIVVGHSLGGGSALIAQLLQTQATGLPLFEAMLLYEPMVIFNPRNTAQKMGLAREKAMQSPTAVQTLRRRAQWPSVDDARAYFLSKPMYAAFDDRVLQQFLDTGIIRAPSQEGAVLQLACSPENEATIFGSGMNADLWDLLHASSNSLGGSHVHVVCGNVSRVKGMPPIWTPKDASEVFSAVEPPAESSVINAGHLWPLEAPAGFARLVAAHFGLLASSRPRSARL
jgi:pimeloyl-ACP methyl ester carboxylesterase